MHTAQGTAKHRKHTVSQNATGAQHGARARHAAPLRSEVYLALRAAAGEDSRRARRRCEAGPSTRQGAAAHGKRRAGQRARTQR